MGIISSSALFCDNSTDANFRAWVQFVQDTLVTTGGWVVTGDSGQMTISTASHPTSINQKVGYRVYRMNDALQATSPVFMRLDYGASGTSGSTSPGIWVTIGTGSDGAGNITNNRFPGGSATSATLFGAASSSSTATHSYGSADTNRVQLALFVTSSASKATVFSVERTKDSSGNDTGDGLLFTYAFNSSGTMTHGSSQYIDLLNLTQPPGEGGLTYCINSNNPSSFGGDIGVGVPILFKGIAIQPGTGIMIVHGSDFAAEAQFNMSIYGSVRNYIQLNSMLARQRTANTGQTETGTGVAMRYD